MLALSPAFATQSFTLIPNPKFPPIKPLYFTPQSQNYPIKSSAKLVARAEKKKNGNGLDPEEGRQINGGDGDDVKRDGSNGRPRFNLRWADLVLDPDPDNVVAVGLTGVLAWASLQVLWQLFFISLAIVVAALKYSFIAALLIFILITLL